MGILKGKLEYKKFKRGESLTRREAILAMCYECNGLEESNEDCQSKGRCPLYQYHSYRAREKKKLTQKELNRLEKIRPERFKKKN